LAPGVSLVMAAVCASTLLDALTVYIGGCWLYPVWWWYCLVVLVLFADLLGCTESEVLAWCGISPQACDKVAHAVVVASCFVGVPRVSCALQCVAKRQLHQALMMQWCVEVHSLLLCVMLPMRKWRVFLQPGFIPRLPGQVCAMA
jgi:hypothetical protein